MADPLSIAASVAGLLTLVGQTYSVLNRLSCSFAGAQELADTVRSEIGGLEGLFGQLDDFVQGRTPTSQQQAALVSLAAFSATVAGCVSTFGLLKKTFTDLEKRNAGGMKGAKLTLRGRISWIVKEPTIRSLLADLQGHKTSLILMLQIMTCTSMCEAKQVVKRLDDHMEEVLKSNNDIRDRIMLVQHPEDAGSLAEGFHSAVSIITNDVSSHYSTSTADTTCGQPNPLARLSEDVDSTSVPFEVTLQNSPVYLRHSRPLSASATSTATFKTSLATVSSRRSRTLTIADVPDIATVALPLSSDERRSFQESLCESESSARVVHHATEYTETSIYTRSSRSRRVHSASLSGRGDALETTLVQRDQILEQLEHRKTQRERKELEEEANILWEELVASEKRRHDEFEQRVMKQRELAFLGKENEAVEAELGTARDKMNRLKTTARNEKLALEKSLNDARDDIQALNRVVQTKEEENKSLNEIVGAVREEMQRLEIRLHTVCGEMRTHALEAYSRTANALEPAQGTRLDSLRAETNKWQALFQAAHVEHLAQTTELDGLRAEANKWQARFQDEHLARKRDLESSARELDDWKDLSQKRLSENERQKHEIDLLRREASTVRQDAQRLEESVQSQLREKAELEKDSRRLERLVQSQLREKTELEKNARRLEQSVQSQLRENTELENALKVKHREVRYLEYALQSEREERRAQEDESQELRADLKHEQDAKVLTMGSVGAVAMTLLALL